MAVFFKSRVITTVGKDVEKVEPTYFIDGMQNGAADLENGLALP